MNSQSLALGSKPPLVAAHGGGVRGAVLPRRSPQFEGRFGRLFRALPPAEFDVADLVALAAEGAMTSEPEKDADGLPAAAPESGGDSRFQDAEENAGVDAGYTYLGQFIDHDITFDPASSLQKVNDPDGLVDYRSPRLDLDCLYGRGPDDQPYMYTADGRQFLLGESLTQNGQSTNARDLPRHEWDEPQADGAGQTSAHFARALIGDKRNDENVIVSQLQGVMLQFHNRLVDEYNLSFAEAQRLVRWHYQYIVVFDYLPRIVGQPMVHSILPHLKEHHRTGPVEAKLRFYHFRDELFIPIEFAAAAYRFGHSMVRPIYRLNTQLQGGDDPNQATQSEKDRGLAGRFFIFAGVSQRGLNGFDRFPRTWAIDWSLFFDINGSGKLTGEKRVQPAYKIDTSLVNPLAFLPEFSLIEPASTYQPLTLERLRPRPRPGAVANLALRNLERGLFMSLPSGESVARAMGEHVLGPDELRIGKATFEDAFEGENKRLIDISPNFRGNTPLWCYILAEALAQWMADVRRSEKSGEDADRIPVTLGPVGGRLVAETLIGLLIGDSHSFLSQDPHWSPLIPSQSNRLRMGDIVKYALRL